MTTWVRLWREFPLWRGRLVMPMSVGCVMWTAYHGFVILTGQGLGRLLEGPVGDVLGAVSILTALVMTLGWWLRRMDWMQHGMVLTACLLGATTATLWGEGVGIISGGYNVPWLVMTGLAWLIEVRDPRPGRP